MGILSKQLAYGLAPASHSDPTVWRKLVDDIYQAFPIASLPSEEIGFFEGRAQDDYLKPTDLAYLRAKSNDQRLNWHQLALLFIEDIEHIDGEPSFMTPKGFYFYLPALMVSGYDDVVDRFFENIQAALQNNIEHFRWHVNNALEQYLGIVKNLSFEQKKCILAYYEFRIDYDDWLLFLTSPKGVEHPNWGLVTNEPLNLEDANKKIQDCDDYKRWFFLRKKFASF